MSATSPFWTVAWRPRAGRSMIGIGIHRRRIAIVGHMGFFGPVAVREAGKRGCAHGGKDGLCAGAWQQWRAVLALLLPRPAFVAWNLIGVVRIVDGIAFIRFRSDLCFRTR